MNLTTLYSEGNLISADLLDQIRNGEAVGQKQADFGLNGKIRLIDEIAACWADAKAYWAAFQHAKRKVGEAETGASVTREQWVIPLLRTMGFENISFARSAAQARPCGRTVREVLGSSRARRGGSGLRDTRS